jgi:hypothetical protein
MDNSPEFKTSSQSDVGEFQTQIDALHHLVVSVLALLVVVSGTLGLYLWRQYRSANAELAMTRPQVENMVGQFQRSGYVQLSDEFVKSLIEYSKAHPDFTPILAKYGIRVSTPTTGVSPAGITQKK